MFDTEKVSQLPFVVVNISQIQNKFGKKYGD